MGYAIFRVGYSLGGSARLTSLARRYPWRFCVFLLGPTIKRARARGTEVGRRQSLSACRKMILVRAFRYRRASRLPESGRLLKVDGGRLERLGLHVGPGDLDDEFGLLGIVTGTEVVLVELVL